MSAALTTVLGAAGVVAAMLAVLLPVIVTQGKSLRRELDHLRGDVAEVRGDLRSLTTRVDALAERVAHVEAGMRSLDDRTARIETAMLAHGERVARIEGALTGPWRPPTNGTPAPNPPPEGADA